MNRDEAFEQLYRRYYRRVMRYLVDAFRLSRDDADDVAQDAFLRVFAVADQYRGESEWSFVKTVATRVVLNRVRASHTLKRGSSSLHRPVTDADLPSNAPDEPAPQEKLFAAGEAAAQLYKAIEHLSPASRAVLLLQLSEFDVAEIAHSLGVDEATVKTRLQTARKQLRDMLRETELSHPLEVSSLREEVVPHYARQKLIATSALPDAASTEQALSLLIEQTDALITQHQYLQRQFDEYAVMLTRHLDIIAVAEVTRAWPEAQP